MTIAEYIREMEIKSNLETIEKYPLMYGGILAERMRKGIKNMQEMSIEDFKKMIGTPDKNDKSFLDIEFKEVVAKKGKGGRTYYSFNDNVNFFPSARFGWYASVGM